MKDKVEKQPVLFLKKAKKSRQKQSKDSGSSHGWKVLKRVLLILLAVLLSVLLYLFLLLGEPDEDSKYSPSNEPETILTPGASMEIPGSGDPQALADRFGAPIMLIYNGAVMQSGRVEDFPFAQGYARRVTILYRMEDGSQCRLESIRPKEAITTLTVDGFRLDGNALYTMGGIRSARMDSPTEACFIGESEQVLYRLTVDTGSGINPEALVKQTYTLRPAAEE